jgi:hypothetical protein
MNQRTAYIAFLKKMKMKYLQFLLFWKPQMIIRFHDKTNSSMSFICIRECFQYRHFQIWDFSTKLLGRMLE